MWPTAPVQFMWPTVCGLAGSASLCGQQCQFVHMAWPTVPVYITGSAILCVWSGGQCQFMWPTLPVCCVAWPVVPVCVCGLADSVSWCVELCHIATVLLLCHWYAALPLSSSLPLHVALPLSCHLPLSLYTVTCMSPYPGQCLLSLHALHTY